MRFNLLSKLRLNIVSLFSFLDSYSGGKGAGDLSLSFEAIEALGFLIAGSVDRNRYVYRRRTIRTIR